MLAGAGPAWAQEPVGVRVGDHPGYGRLVFEVPGTPRYEVEQRAGVLVLRFPEPVAVDLAAAQRRPPRNLMGRRRHWAGRWRSGSARA